MLAFILVFLFPQFSYRSFPHPCSPLFHSNTQHITRLHTAICTFSFASTLFYRKLNITTLPPTCHPCVHITHNNLQSKLCVLQKNIWKCKEKGIGMNIKLCILFFIFIFPKAPSLFHIPKATVTATATTRCKYTYITYASGGCWVDGIWLMVEKKDKSKRNERREIVYFPFQLSAQEINHKFYKSNLFTFIP